MLYRGEAGSHFGAYGAARRSCVTGRVKLGERYETWAAEVRSKRFKENTSRFHVVDQPPDLKPKCREPKGWCDLSDFQL